MCVCVFDWSHVIIPSPDSSFTLNMKPGVEYRGPGVHAGVITVILLLPRNLHARIKPTHRTQRWNRAGMVRQNRRGWTMRAKHRRYLVINHEPASSGP